MCAHTQNSSFLLANTQITWKERSNSLQKSKFLWELVYGKNFWVFEQKLNITNLGFFKKLSLEKFYSLPTLKLTSNHTLFILNVIFKFYKLEIVYINTIKVLTLAKSELLWKPNTFVKHLIISSWLCEL